MVTLAKDVSGAVAGFVDRRRRWLGGALILAAVIAFYVQGTNLSTATSRISALQQELSVTVRESAMTRITTVTQRCLLTHLDSQLAAAVHQPTLEAQYITSYVGCEKQLEKVKKIAKEAR